MVSCDIWALKALCENKKDYESQRSMRLPYGFLHVQIIPLLFAGTLVGILMQVMFICF